MDSINRRNFEKRLRPVENLVDPHSKRFRADAEYDIKEQIGRGAYSVVKRARHRRTTEEVAIKIIDKKENSDVLDLIRHEIEVMRILNHPNIVRLLETYEDAYTLEIVMELISGGELFEVIVEKGFFSEDDSAFIIRQILLGISHCHQKRVVHRDLKPENILCVNTDDGDLSKVVLCDFGVSMVLPTDGALLQGRFGSADYISPEMHQDKEYSTSTDMWSLGIIAYIILAGYPPFSPENEEDEMSISKSVIHDEVQFPDEEWSIISPEAKDFIQRLLQKNPANRMSAAEALLHPFMTSRFGEPETLTPVVVDVAVEPAVVMSVEPVAQQPEPVVAVETGPAPDSPKSDTISTESGSESASQPQTTTSDAAPEAATAEPQKPHKVVMVTSIEVGPKTLLAAISDRTSTSSTSVGSPRGPSVLSPRDRVAQDAAAAKRAQNLKQFNAKRRFAGAKNLFKFFSNKFFGDSSSSKSSSEPKPSTSSSSSSSSKSAKRQSQAKQTPLASSSSPNLNKGKIAPIVAPKPDSPPASPKKSPTSASFQTASILKSSSGSSSPTNGSPAGSPRLAGSTSTPSIHGNKPNVSYASPASSTSTSSSTTAPVEIPVKPAATQASDSIVAPSSSPTQTLSGFALLKKKFESLVSSPTQPPSSTSSPAGVAKKSSKKSTPPETRSPSPEGRQRATTIDFGSNSFEARSAKPRSRQGSDTPVFLDSEPGDAIKDSIPVTEAVTIANDLPPQSLQRDRALIRVHSLGKDERRKSSRKVSRQSSAKSDASSSSSSMLSSSHLAILAEKDEPKTLKSADELSDSAPDSPTMSRSPSMQDTSALSVGSKSLAELPSYSDSLSHSLSSAQPASPVDRAMKPRRNRSGTISVIGATTSDSVPSIQELRHGSPERQRSPLKNRTKSSVKEIVGAFESLTAEQQAAQQKKSKKESTEKPSAPEPAPEKPRKTGNSLLRIMSVGIFKRNKVAAPEEPAPAPTPSTLTSEEQPASPKTPTKSPKSNGSLLSRSKSTVGLPKEDFRVSSVSNIHQSHR